MNDRPFAAYMNRAGTYAACVIGPVSGLIADVAGELRKLRGVPGVDTAHRYKPHGDSREPVSLDDLVSKSDAFARDIASAQVYDGAPSLSDEQLRRLLAHVQHHAIDVTDVLQEISGPSEGPLLTSALASGERLNEAATTLLALHEAFEAGRDTRTRAPSRRVPGKSR